MSNSHSPHLVAFSGYQFYCKKGLGNRVWYYLKLIYPKIFNLKMWGTITKKYLYGVVDFNLTQKEILIDHHLI